MHLASTAEAIYFSIMRNNLYRQRALFTQPPKPKPPKKKWRIAGFLWKALKRTCMVLGAFILMGAISGAILSNLALQKTAAPLPDEIVLYLPLEDGFSEHSNQQSPYGFTDQNLTAREVTAAIDHAAKDKRVKGFLMKLEGGGLNLAHIEELRAAVLRFRESGKFAYIYAPSYDSLGKYYLASAFEQIWLQPMGILSIPGIQVEMPFARQALQKIGVEPQFFARKEYKTLFESLTNTEMSPESRAMMTRLVSDIGGTIKTGIAASRDMDEAAVQAQIDKALLTDAEALESGLVDKLDYTDTLNEIIKEKVTGDPENEDKIFIFMARYLQDMEEKKSFAPPVKKPKVALIYAVGQIVQNDEGGKNLGAAENLVSEIRKAADDASIDVIVVRVDSPGGSPTASETIRRAIVKAQEKGKKIVVSMGASAASGGYWIIADADHIFALPTTMTGSIGVTGGKVSLREMWGHLGINWDRVQWGDNAGIWSLNRPYSESGAARMNYLMDDIYKAFVTRVAEGRDMSFEQADSIAGGRVWTGLSAKEVGLVDELGGLDDALDYAAVLAGAADRHGVKIVVLPRRKTALEKVLALLENHAMVVNFLRMNAGALQTLATGLEKINTLTAGEPGWALAR